MRFVIPSPWIHRSTVLTEERRLRKRGEKKRSVSNISFGGAHTTKIAERSLALSSQPVTAMAHARAN